MAQDDRIAGLARQIDAARRRDPFAKSAEQVAALRRQGACELHAICAAFVSSINARLPDAALNLSPSSYAPGSFRDSGVNLFQISSNGREVHIAFHTPRTLVSAEKFLIPYVLEGEVRAFNQEMLERFEIRIQFLFYCLEEDRASWRFFDWKTRHTGLFGEERLLDIMEGLFA